MGIAISFVTQQDEPLIRNIEREIQQYLDVKRWTEPLPNIQMRSGPRSFSNDRRDSRGSGNYPPRRDERSHAPREYHREPRQHSDAPRNERQHEPHSEHAAEKPQAKSGWDRWD